MKIFPKKFRQACVNPKFNRILIGCLFLFFVVNLLGGCMAYFQRHLTAEGKEVYVHDKKPKGCESLGQIKLESGMPEKVHVVNYFRNIAAKKGGNGIRIKSLDKVYMGRSDTGYGGKAYIYKCKHGSSSADIVGFIF